MKPIRASLSFPTRCKCRVSVWSPFLRWHVEVLTDVSIPPTNSHARTHCQQHPNQINLRAYTSRSWEMKSLFVSSPQTKSKQKLPFDIVQACVKGAHWSLLHINTAPVKQDRKIWHFAYHKVFKDEDELNPDHTLGATKYIQHFLSDGKWIKLHHYGKTVNAQWFKKEERREKSK